MSFINGTKPGSTRMSKAYLSTLLSNDDFQKYEKYHRTIIERSNSRGFWKGWEECSEPSESFVNSIKRDVDRFVWYVVQMEKFKDEKHHEKFFTYMNEYVSVAIEKARRIQDNVDDYIGGRS